MSLPANVIIDEAQLRLHRLQFSGRSTIFKKNPVLPIPISAHIDSFHLKDL